MTQVLLEVLAERRRANKDKWEAGVILDLAKDTQMLLNAAAIGENQGYKFVQELDFEQLQGEMTDVGE